MLQDGISITKHHPIIQALSALDELNANLGLIKNLEPIPEIDKIQKNVTSIMSLISTTSQKTYTGVTLEDFFQEETHALEIKIDKLSIMIPPISGFVAYGNCQISAQLDLARAVARRAETLLSQIDSNYVLAAFPYINRLSDYLYMKARYADFENMIIKAVHETLENATHTEMNLAHGKSILEKIEKKARDINLSVAAAVTNAAGSPIAMHVMDGALLVGYEAAVAKAYTAAAVKMSTMELSRLVQPGQQFYGLESMEGGKILPIGGGVPMIDKTGRLVGAIGVSGGTVKQDHELAEIGRSNFSAS